MSYYGDFTEDYATLNFKFTSRTTTGVPTTLAGTPVVSVYKANDLTQSVVGVTLTVDFDGVTGLNNVLIDLSADAFYAVGNDYNVVITTGTVGGVSVVGEVVGSFSIENRFMRGTDSGATEAKQDIIDTVVDGIQTDLSNVTDGLGALKTLLDAIPTTAMRGTDSAATEAKQDTIDTVVDGIQTDLSNGTDGLGALKALIDAIPTTAMRGTDSAALASVWTAARAAALTDWLDGGRLDLLLDAIPTTVMRGTDNAATAAVWTEVRAGALTDWIDAGRLDALLDAIKAVTDNLPNSGALTTIGTDTARLTAVRAAVLTDWINAGRLDALLDAVKAKTDNLPGSPAAVGSAMTLAADAVDAAAIKADAGTELATALLDLANGVETSYTLRQTMRLILSAVACKLDGAATANIHTRNSADTKNRITAVTDADGNRTGITHDVS